jgi:hypothetical protein
MTQELTDNTGASVTDELDLVTFSGVITHATLGET